MGLKGWVAPDNVRSNKVGSNAQGDEVARFILNDGVGTAVIKKGILCK